MLPKMMLESFRKAFATGRPGTPVAARLLLECRRGESDADPELAFELAVATETLQQLFESRVDTMSVFGSQASGQLSGLFRFDGGQSALISVSFTRREPRRVCYVFADRGTLHWEGRGATGSASLTEPPAVIQLSKTAAGLLTRIQESAAGAAPGATANPFPDPVDPVACPPPYGILLVAGDHTHQPGYAEALAADARCHLVAVTDEVDISDDRRQKNRQFAERLGLPYLDDLDAALAREDIHIVSVCAEPFRRGPIIVRAAKAGKHLYLDKPLCGTQAEVDAIVTAVRDARVVAHMFSQVQFDPALQARHLATSGQLGELIAIHTDLCFAKGYAGTAQLGKGRTEAERPLRYELMDSKRELTNVGIYNVVLLLWLTRRRVRRVAATTGNYFFAEHQANDMEDFGQILLEFEDGMTATISAGRLGWKSHPSSGLNRTYLVGTLGSSIVDAHEGRVEMWTAADAWQPPPRNPEDPMGMWQAPPGDPFQASPKQDWIVPGSTSWQLDSDHFLDCVELGRASEVPVELAGLATEVLLAAYRSAATGLPVELAQT